jgi:hypothetical protein
MASGRRKRNPAQAEDWAKWLADYLNIEVDPYDFSALIPDWDPSLDIEMVDELSPEQQQAFEEWLKTSKAIEKEMQHDPTGVPSYVYFEDASPLGPNAWCVHFGSASFSSFDRGATADRLGLSTHFREKVFVDCSANLTDDQGPFDVVYGFAFAVGDLSRHRIFDAQRVDAGRRWQRRLRASLWRPRWRQLERRRCCDARGRRKHAVHHHIDGLDELSFRWRDRGLGRRRRGGRRGGRTAFQDAAKLKFVATSLNGHELRETLDLVVCHRC